MKISKRLKVISDLIPDNSFFLDIGCDHALTSIYTVLNKKNAKAIASDIKEKPLKRAKENVKKYGVQNKIEIIQGDGLSVYKQGIDTVIISGLGTNTILSILEKDKNYLEKIERLIISSNNDYYLLRKNICNLGFSIENEKIVFENNKYYPIIVFKHEIKKYNKQELKYGPILLKEKDITFLNYLKEIKNKNIEIHNLLKNKHFIKKIKLKKEIKNINKILSKN